MFRKVLLAWSLFVLTMPTVLFSQKSPGSRKFKTVVIDPGHGGKDPGAKGLHTTEAALALQISKRLGLEIKKLMPKVKVLFTRTSDKLPGNKQDINEGLRYRAEFANRSSADLFISIHCNSAGKEPGGWHERKLFGFKKKWVTKGKERKKILVRVPLFKDIYMENATSGTESYVWAARENEQKREMVGNQNDFENNTDKNIDLKDNEQISTALSLIYTQNYFAKSLRMANLVQTGFQRTGRINRGVKQRNNKGIWVLHATGMPGILVETGFITNRKEEQYLISSRGQNAVAKTIAEALKKYIKSLVRNKNGKHASNKQKTM